MSEYISIAILLNVLVYSLGIIVVIKNGGIKKNLTFAFCILLFILYYFITPVYFYFVGRKTIWGDEGFHRGVGVNILDFYDNGLIYYGLASLFFILGYISKRSNNFVYKGEVITKNIKTDDKKKAVIFSFVICFSIVIYNFLSGGFNLLNLIFGEGSELIAGKESTSNYLKNFADSLIAILIMGKYYRVNNKVYIILLILSFLLFALMGFRYRIILTILGIAFCSLYQSKLTRKKIVSYTLGSVMFLYLMFFITYNRWVFTNANWSNIIYNPAKFKYELFFEQTRGMLDDITILKYYHTAKNPEYDYGVTFLYFLVRMMPRSVVGDDFKDSFYPFPAYNIITKAYDVKKDWGSQNTGEAPLHLAYFYIAFGIYGLFGISFLTGRFLNWFKRKYRLVNHNNILLHILITAAFFQWITRGYFPGFVDHLVFMLIGFIMVKKLGNLNLLNYKYAKA